MIGAVSVRTCVSALTLLLSLSPAAATSGAELLRQCQPLMQGATMSGKKVTLPRGSDAAACWFYMGAIQDLLATVESEGGPSVLGACVPAATTRMEIVAAFVKYARSQRADLPMRATVIIIPALNNAFPCTP
jgi:hypothetical protein